MGAFLKSLFGLSDAQARSVFVWLRVAAAVLAALALLNAGLWLASALWNTSAASPFGLWGFLVAVAIAAAAGGFTYWRLTRRRRAAPPSSFRTASLAERYAADVTNAPLAVEGDERRRWRETGGETPVALRNRIKAAVNSAENSGSLAELEAGDALMKKLLILDPGSEDWARSVRWEIAQLKKRL